VRDTNDDPYESRSLVTEGWVPRYQFYFHGDRGQAGLTRHRRQLCKLLWTLWSPGWDFDDETFARTAESFDNPDFVEVVIHSYRHRFVEAPLLVLTAEKLVCRPELWRRCERCVALRTTRVPQP
jgi:hypothetical protein